MNNFIFTSRKIQNKKLMTFLEQFGELILYCTPPNLNWRGQVNIEIHSGDLLKWNKNCWSNEMTGKHKWNYQTGNLKQTTLIC